MLEIVEKWQETNLLRGIAENHVADMAYMLENQRLYNETLVESSQFDTPQFRRISIPLDRRIFPNLESHKKYNVESKLGLESCLQKPLNLSGVWDKAKPEEHPHEPTECFNRLNREAESTAELAETLRVAIDQFIESQTPFNTFYVQALGVDKKGQIVLYYDQD